MTTRPRIGVLMDYEATGSFSTRPHYALRCAYFDAVWASGGLPIALPYLAAAASDYLDTCDALILPGGFYPFPAKLYGKPTPTAEEVHPRHAFEVELTRHALERDTPLLGICAGMQVIAATQGATLHGDIRNDLPGPIDHLNERPAEQAAHAVDVTPGTLLHRLTGKTSFDVNTAHNEALKDIPENLVINARAPDGVVEGIELPDRAFCLGVQWHPEFFLEDGDPNRALFDALVSAARGSGGALDGAPAEGTSTGHA